MTRNYFYFKVERLQSKQKELRSHLDGFLTDFMSQIFSGLFVHRYRDCRAEIRSICIQELGKKDLLFVCNHKLNVASDCSHKFSLN